MRRALLLGVPGSGKITRARELTRALTPLTGDARVELAWIYHGARLDQPWLYHDKSQTPAPADRPYVPFRAPHHTCSEAAIIGGGAFHRPGEASLAHGGTLLLDELPEFRRGTIDSLAYVLDKGEAQVSHWCAIPARPQLLLACANPCPCGYLGSDHPCRCSRRTLAAYASQLTRFTDALRIDEIIPCRPRTIAQLFHGDAS